MSEQRIPDPTEPTSWPPLSIGKWKIRPAENRISGNGKTVQVEPRAMHVLVCLAARPGEVITRAELMQTVWGETVVLEKALTSVISDLRHALDDDPANPHLIETIRKVGYRLIAPVSPPGAAMAVRRGGVPERRRLSMVSQRPRRALIALALLFTAGVVLSLSLAPRWFRATRQAWPGLPLTTYPGCEHHPALSPNGTRVAFCWTGAAGEDGTDLDIYVKQLNAESPLRLTDHPGRESLPTWSPDGAEIAFVREIGAGEGIFTVPAVGGEAHKLFASAFSIGDLDWSPDGSQIAFASRTAAGEPTRIQILSLPALEIRQLTAPPPRPAGDISPSFSPDGQTVAFVRANKVAQQDIYLTAAGGGEARRLTHGQHKIGGIDWMPNGREILFAATPVGAFHLWRIGITDGSLSYVPVAGSPVVHPSVSGQRNRLVYAELSYECNIWGMRISAEREVAFLDEPLIASTRMDHQPVWSPGGNRIAFISDRSGSREIWMTDAAGTDPHQLTDLVGTHVINPRWAPDEERIAFSGIPEGYMNVYVMNLDDRAPRRLKAARRHELVVAWDHDGEWLYFQTDVAEGWQIWRMRPDGTGREVLTDPGYEALEANSTGDSILCLKRPEGEIWRVSLTDGGAERIVDADTMRSWWEIAPAGGGLFHLRALGGDRAVLARYDLAAARDDSLAEVPISIETLAISPDQTMLLYGITRRIESDLILVEGFE
jgi:Tol biopolymer transport system component/DNA-binding winged helix-turn-helix (wHTH) protein